MPERIQLRRTKGWRKPEDAIVVSRPTKWGNPFTVEQAIEAEYSNPRSACVSHYHAWMEGHHHYFDVLTTYGRDYDRRARLAELDELRGHDLACWCSLDQPCHADVLLELANQEAQPDGA